MGRKRSLKREVQNKFNGTCTTNGVAYRDAMAIRDCVK